MIFFIFQKLSLMYINDYKSINNADNYIQNIEKFIDTKVLQTKTKIKFNSQNHLNNL